MRGNLTPTRNDRSSKAGATLTLVALIVLTLTLSGAAPALAGSGSGQITRLLVVHHGTTNGVPNAYVRVRLTVPKTDIPSCTLNTGLQHFWHLRLDGTEKANGLYSLLLLASGTGLDIHISGTGFCGNGTTAPDNLEQIFWAELQP